MFLFMAFNEPRILNQSTIKENKQGHPEDSEDHLKKNKKMQSSQVVLNSLNPYSLTVLTSIPSPTILLHFCICMYAPTHPYTKLLILHTRAQSTAVWRWLFSESH